MRKGASAQINEKRRACKYDAGHHKLSTRGRIHSKHRWRTHKGMDVKNGLSLTQNQLNGERRLRRDGEKN